MSQRTSSATDQGRCHKCNCARAVWSGYCRPCYRKEFGEPPQDPCMHGNDPNHVPCQACWDLHLKKRKR